MLLRDKVEVTLYRDFTYYKILGYKLPFHIDSRGRRVSKGEKIMVKVKDLPPKSTVIIDAECDYCGKIYHPKYVNYYAGHKEIEKDSCSKCKHLKTKEIYLLKYKTTSLKTRSEIEGFKIGRKKIDIEIIYDEFYKRNLVPIFNESEYVNSKAKLPYLCEKHKDKSIQYISYDVLQNSKFGCNSCAREHSNNSKRYPLEFVIETFTKKDYTLLSKAFKNVDQKLEFICNRHKDFGVQTATFWNVLQNVNNCKRCRFDMQSGELHYNWQGGISSERDKFTISTEYKNWRKSVFNMDDYTCQCCGKRGKRLEAHHIKNYSSYPELRTDIDNGITLCYECHNPNSKGSFHYIYSKYNNTLEQLEEYIQRYKSREFDKLRCL